MRIKNKHLISYFILLYFCLLVSPSFATNGWNAGVAKCVITPKENMWMAGYAFRTKPGEGKLHDLWAKVLFLEDSVGNSALLVTSDIVYFTKGISDLIRQELKESLGLDKAQIILNSSHTHSGPELIGNNFRYTYAKHFDQLYETNGKYHKMSEDYSYWLIKTIVKLAEEAKHAKQPVNIYSGNGTVRFQVNRRSNKESELTNTHALKGPNDFSVPVLKIEDKQKNIKAIVFGYACHATVLNGYEWSGDYPGFAQIELEEKYEGAMAMFFQGAGADLNPIPRRTIPLAKQYGEELAVAVERTLNDDMQFLTPTLETNYSEINLRFGQSDLSARKQMEDIVKESSDFPDYDKRNAKYVLEQLNSGKNLTTSSYPFPAQVWKIGQQLILSLGGELTVGYTIKLKEIFGENIFVLGYSNDVMGYIPTKEILNEGGYEGTRAPVPSMSWTKDIEDNIINEAIRLVSETSYHYSIKK